MLRCLPAHQEHLDHHIPDTFKSINNLMRQLKLDIGVDDRYIALMLDALSREYSASSQAVMVRLPLNVKGL